MKAEFIVAARAVNPLFDNEAKRQAAEQGKVYEHKPFVEVPVGTIEEGPLVWVHCCPGYMNEPPICKPVDDQCKERVKLWMEVQRPRELEQLRLMAHPDNMKNLKPDVRSHVNQLLDAYELDPEGDPVTVTTNNTPASEEEPSA